MIQHIDSINKCISLHFDPLSDPEIDCFWTLLIHNRPEQMATLLTTRVRRLFDFVENATRHRAVKLSTTINSETRTKSAAGRKGEGKTVTDTHGVYGIMRISIKDEVPINLAHLDPRGSIFRRKNTDDIIRFVRSPFHCSDGLTAVIKFFLDGDQMHFDFGILCGKLKRFCSESSSNLQCSERSVILAFYNDPVRKTYVSFADGHL